ncbi:rod shape-determining protein [Companilactobacillus sp. RD055328]|uniref:rod shape-determining protein n=1 Tax=Companilactobacillus sp. RD055328 TaxID=2916634 RepID=UPI001FC873D0|nr:rod shape-determining protein [Companilactobacillus sp. RD055328]GKQ42877.1 rod shape-determining protein [Companilactobacillus sp. RD055328]
MAKDIGIDLGTANVLINIKGEGIVLNEPSVVAVNTSNNEVVAVGTEAYEMVGRTPGNIQVIRPLEDGVISDFKTTESMLTYFIDKLKVRSKFSKPNIMICCPADVTSVEQRAIIEAAEKAGGKQVYLELEPKVAAVGAGMDIFKPQGNLVIDIGGGTSDIAVLSMGSVVSSNSLRLAGDKMNSDIQFYVKQKHNLMIGERTAETIKKQVGSAFEPDASVVIPISGRDLMTGLPREVSINEVEAEEALHESLQAIIEATKGVLEVTPPELAADIIDRGVMLTGGGSLLKGMDKLFARELQIPVLLAEDPLDSVALGTGILLEHINKK